jgi:hypothetical protein
MTERWVNAKISFTVPLDSVSVKDTKETKLNAAVEMAEKLFPEMGGNDAVGTISFENVCDGEPISELVDCICPFPDEHGYVRADCPVHDPLENFHGQRVRENARRFEERHPNAVAKLASQPETDPDEERGE